MFERCVVIGGTTITTGLGVYFLSLGWLASGLYVLGVSLLIWREVLTKSPVVL